MLPSCAVQPLGHPSPISTELTLGSRASSWEHRGAKGGVNTAPSSILVSFEQAPAFSLAMVMIHSHPVHTLHPSVATLQPDSPALKVPQAPVSYSPFFPSSKQSRILCMQTSLC